MSTKQHTRQMGDPGLAPRMRKSAAILTRCACLLASDRTTHNGFHPGIHSRNFTMTGLIRAVRRELFPDPRRKVRDGEPTEQAWAFAYALIAQDPIDKTPEVRDLVAAAGKLREWAAAEEAMSEPDRWELTEKAARNAMPTVAEMRAAEAEIYKIMGEGWPYQGNLTLSAADDGGLRASILLYFGTEHELASSDSLEGLLADARQRAINRGRATDGKEAA